MPRPAEVFVRPVTMTEGRRLQRIGRTAKDPMKLWRALLDVAIVAAVPDYVALVIEAQHRHSREREFLALLGLAAPPFDRGPVAGDDRLAEPAPSAVSSVCERL